MLVIQTEKPKKQRRKPAIAEVKDEEDGDVPSAAPHGSADLEEEDPPEIKADDDNDEPVSESDQEAEAELEVAQETKKRAYVRSVAPISSRTIMIPAY